MKNYREQEPITAVICASDFVGVGLMNTATKMGIKVPVQLNIISFDGTNLVDIVRPRITSVTQQFYAMGTEGIDFILKNAHSHLNTCPLKLLNASQQVQSISVGNNILHLLIE